MAEAFEERLYALIAELGETPAFIERFKAKGDAALLYSDLEADPDDLGEAHIDLMVEYGVPMPWGKRSSAQQMFFSKGYWILRDMTVGELKQTVAAGRWPEDAWSYHKNTFWDHLRAAVMVPVTMIAAFVLLPIFLVISAAVWLFTRVFRKAA